jgi:hypothetical protein
VMNFKPRAHQHRGFFHYYLGKLNLSQLKK